MRLICVILYAVNLELMYAMCTPLLTFVKSTSLVCNCSLTLGCHISSCGCELRHHRSESSWTTRSPTVTSHHSWAADHSDQCPHTDHACSTDGKKKKQNEKIAKKNNNNISADNKTHKRWKRTLNLITGKKTKCKFWVIWLFLSLCLSVLKICALFCIIWF